MSDFSEPLLLRGRHVQLEALAVVFSIIASEWPAVKRNLTSRLHPGDAK